MLRGFSRGYAVIDWGDSTNTGVVLFQHIEKHLDCNSLDIELIGTLSLNIEEVDHRANLTRTSNSEVRSYECTAQ